MWIAPAWTGVSFHTWQSILIRLPYIDATSKMCGVLLLLTVYMENLHITNATNHTASQKTDCTLCKLNVITAFIRASHWTISSATEIKSMFLDFISLYFISAFQIFWIKYCRLFSTFHIKIYTLPISFLPFNSWWRAKKSWNFSVLIFLTLVTAYLSNARAPLSTQLSDTLSVSMQLHHNTI